MAAAHSQSGPLARIEGVTVSLPGATEPLLDLPALAIAGGTTLGLVGESGCGKSVTALAMMGLLAPRLAARVRGTLHFDGAALALSDGPALAGLRGRRIGMIFQEPMSSLNPVHTIGAQIAEAWARHHPGRPAAEAQAAARAMLDRVGIPDARRRMDEHPHRMSGGMRQRVMIAMALVNRPDLLIADEPTTALDVTIQAQILALIAELQAETGMATLLITHDLGVVAQVATDVAVMYAGRIVETGPAGAVLSDPQHPYTIGLMASAPGLGTAPGARLATVPGMVPAPDRMPPGCRFAPRCPFRIPVCASAPPLAAVAGAAPGHAAACHRAPLAAEAAA